MSVILRAAEATQLSLTSAQQKEITDYVNQYRKANQADDLVWNDNIAQFSQNWSNYLVMNDLFQHSGNSLYGENLAYFQGYGTDVMTLLKLSVDLWYKEIDYYNFQKPGFSAETGHFTCLVWKASKTFGMGISIVNDKVVVSFNTSPPGNVIGEFEQNVLPRVGSVPLPVSPPVPTPTSPPTPPPTEPPQETSKYKKFLKIITVLYNIIDEVKKPNLNRQMIIYHLKKIIMDLIH